MLKKIKSLDDIEWKSINLPPTEIEKILAGTKTSFIVRERYKKNNPVKDRFNPKDYVFIREPWSYNARGEFIYKVGATTKMYYWLSPHCMPREAGRIFVRMGKISRNRIQSLSIKDISSYGFDTKEEFAKYWNSIYWRDIDKYEANPMVRIYKFKRVAVRKYGGGQVIKPKSYG